MNQPISHFSPLRLAFVALLATAMLLSCGLTAFAAEIPEELFPASVQTIVENGKRHIVKTYVLTAEQSAADIPRGDFERDGWQYTLTDITEQRTSGIDTRGHTERVEINTDSSDLNEIMALLAATLEYQSEDGYAGVLALDLSSVSCEAAGYKNSSYAVSATREYPHLSANDLSLIPKSITENGRTLELDGVTWEVQQTTNVDYEDIPDSYRAVAKYTATAYKSTVTGYITTAEYTGEIAKTVEGDTVYVAYFLGSEIAPIPEPTEAPAAETDDVDGEAPIIPILIGLAVIAALVGAGAFLFLRSNVKIYSVRDEGRVLVAKDRITAKHLSIDLTPLDSYENAQCFILEIERMAAKSLNGKALEVIYGSAKLQHTIAFEGSAYKIEADFHSATIKAIY